MDISWYINIVSMGERPSRFMAHMRLAVNLSGGSSRVSLQWYLWRNWRNSEETLHKSLFPHLRPMSEPFRKDECMDMHGSSSKGMEEVMQNSTKLKTKRYNIGILHILVPIYYPIYYNGILSHQLIRYGISWQERHWTTTLPSHLGHQRAARCSS